MVSLEAIRASNRRIATDLPAGLVAVFVGATSGIGETSLKQFVKHAKAPRVYFVGRSSLAADRIEKELKALNKEGSYTFLKCEASLLKNVDETCRAIARLEKTINMVFVSTGTLITGTKTEEGLHFFASLTYYARIRFIANLLPLVQHATGLRRVVTVFAGGKEGALQPQDWQAYKLGPADGRAHMASMLTLGLEALARGAPSVSFIQDYPGFVKSGLGRGTKGLGMAAAKAMFKVVGLFLNIPLEEVGERHTFFCTSARFPPKVETNVDAPASGLGGIEPAVGTDGTVGSGVYSISYDAESAGPDALKALANERKNGSADKLWKHTQDEFVRISGSASMY